MCQGADHSKKVIQPGMEEAVPPGADWTSKLPPFSIVPRPKNSKSVLEGQGKAANVGKGLKASRTCLNHSMEVISPASTKFARGFVWGLHAECNG